MKLDKQISGYMYVHRLLAKLYFCVHRLIAPTVIFISNLSPAVSIAVVQLSVYMLGQKSIKFININKLNDLHELVFWTIKILKITLPEYFIISMSISYAINCE